VRLDELLEVSVAVEGLVLGNELDELSQEVHAFLIISHSGDGVESTCAREVANNEHYLDLVCSAEELGRKLPQELGQQVREVLFYLYFTIFNAIKKKTKKQKT
jgi:hypothetical protein